MFSLTHNQTEYVTFDAIIYTLEVIVSILLLGGLPFSGTFWNKVQERLSDHNIESHTWTLCEQAGSLAEQVKILRSFIAKHQVTTIVAHGLSLPLGFSVQQQEPHLRLILTNGLISTKVGIIQWILPQLMNIPCTLKRQLLRPSISIPALASSAAFRRLVINPYVMDKATISELSTALLSNTTYRDNVCAYLSSLEQWNTPSSLAGETHIVWGDHDPLFPVEQLTFLPSQEISSQHIIEGGAHFHPIERPWSIADILAKMTQDSRTSMS